ncbi:MAG: hypothetical protein U1A81_00105 [Hydrogenophaga sp.]|nr:hypothetical protein [Hydrogenophaga sp.]
MYPCFTESLQLQTVPDLKNLLPHVPGASHATQIGNKTALLNAIESGLQGAHLRTMWDALGPVEKDAVAEAVYHPAGEYDGVAFEAKYQASPLFAIAAKQRYGTQKPTALCLLFFYSKETRRWYIPPDLRARLASWVAQPARMVMPVARDLPPEDEVTVRCTERDALQDVLVLLRTLEQTRVQVSDKTAVASAASQRLISAQLAGGDFYSWIDKQNKWDQQVGPIKAFAWPLLLQVGGLAACVSGRLTPTPAGIKALSAPPAQTLRSLWRKWLQTAAFDEFSRVDAIKGQQSAGRVMTALAPRREAIHAALRECPVGQWMQVDTLGRFMRGNGFDFDVAHNTWSLYIADKQYGALGYSGFHDWNIVQLRYLMAVLLEYAATLGLVDVMYSEPQGARTDFQNNWGTDELAFLSRYDGLQCIRINPLGAYVLGLSEDYLPTVQVSEARLLVLPNLQVKVLRGTLEPESQLLLAMWAVSVDARTWQLTPSKAVAAIEKSHDIDLLRQFLASHNDGPLPEEATAFLERCAQDGTALQAVGAATLVECRDEETAETLAIHPETRSLCLRVGPALLVVRNAHLDKFRERLRGLGFGMVD